MMEVSEQIAIDHGLKSEEYKKICKLTNFFILLRLETMIYSNLFTNFHHLILLRRFLKKIEPSSPDKL